MIGQLQVAHDAIKEALVWDPESEDYCLQEVYKRDMLSAPTISALVLHLCALRLLSHDSEVVDFALGIPANLPWGLIRGSNTEGTNDQLQVLGGLFPKRILLPVVDRAASHCYLWYIVASKQSDQSYHLNAQLIDSLSASRNPAVMDMRAHPIREVVERFYPGYGCVLNCSTTCYNRFQQDPRSNDCGYYLAQATSAALFSELHSLNNPLPVESLLVRIAHKLETHWKDRMPVGVDILHVLATEGSEPLHRRSREILVPTLAAASEAPPSLLPQNAQPLSVASPAREFHANEIQGEAWPAAALADDRQKSKTSASHPIRCPPADDDEWHPGDGSSDDESFAVDLDPNNLYEEIMDLEQQPGLTFPEGG
ncbi:hypothetical protein FRC10_011352 [Ceratobasidium sp. 414]|nr:hypothetical protein FRC10_011352 [Ceratobasidium sp. 414]